MNLMSGFSPLSFQPPVSHMMAPTTSLVRMPLKSWSLLSQMNLALALQAVSVLATSSIKAV